MRFKRNLSVVITAIKQIRTMSDTAEVSLFNNFKEWRFKTAPSYAELPINDNPEYNVPVAVNQYIYSKVPTEPLTEPLRLVCFSESALKDVLDLDPQVAQTQEFINFIGGKYLPSGGLTVCHRYGGYQFGFWADQLGDGRAHILGEYINRHNERWQPQLKGSGETPYSRFGDGRAVLRSSIREMIASEAMYALGVPTTRAGALVVSDTHKVWRDKNYTGHARQERAACVLRLAECWYRIGSLEILHKRKEFDLLRIFVNFVIKEHFKNIYDTAGEYIDAEWFREVALRNIKMVAEWQGVGFTHGVLNTDNVSLLGVTIDYGPYGFIDHYNMHHVPNSSDDRGRYAFYRQPAIMLWNLAKLAEALKEVADDQNKQQIDQITRGLEEIMKKKLTTKFLNKLGIDEIDFDKDEALYSNLFDLMQQTSADFTMTFRQLGQVEPSKLLDDATIENKWALKKLSSAKEGWEKWVHQYRERLENGGVTEEKRTNLMLKVNPIYVPRNWMLQEAIVEAEEDDFEKVRFLMKVLTNPFEEDSEAEERGFSSPPPSWAYGIRLSCSS